jgi:hypothetical protein
MTTYTRTKDAHTHTHVTKRWDGGRGLVAARDIARGEQLIVVEEKAQLFYSKERRERPAVLALE